MVWKRSDDTPEPASYSPQPPTASGAPPASPSRRERAVIGQSITIQGDLSGEEDLTILGRVQGKVDVKSNSVTVGESGFVQADVYGKSIIVEGEVEGNLFGGEQIVLHATGKVRGNLTAPRVSLDDGAQFKGAIDMEPKRPESAGSRASGQSGQRPAGSPGAAGSSGPAGSSGSSGSGSSGSPGSPGAPSERDKAAAKAGG